MIQFKDKQGLMKTGYATIITGFTKFEMGGERSRGWGLPRWKECKQWRAVLRSNFCTNRLFYTS